jgi:hypothetical protein
MASHIERREFLATLGGGGRVAACGARAAGGEAANHRVIRGEHSFRLEPLGRRVRATAW